MHSNLTIRTHRRSRFKHLAFIAVLGVAITGCNAAKSMKPQENIVPPQPGVPAGPSDIQGIYRTVHQGLLQLRGNGQFVMIIPAGPGPSGGTYTLRDGTLTVTTDSCGEAVGQYHLVVNGPPEAGKANIVFTLVDDSCEPRRKYLTIDPWIYANS